MKLTILLVSLVYLTKSCAQTSNRNRRPDNVRKVEPIGNPRETPFPGGSNAGRPLPRDFLFILDTSDNISSREWATTKRKLADLVEKLCGGIGVGRWDNRIAVITFSSRVVLNFNFKTHWTITSVRRAILSLPKIGGRACTGDAIGYAASYMYNSNKGVRPVGQSIREVLVLTNGHANCGSNLASNLRRLQHKAFMLALSIGTYGTSGKREIRSIVTRPLIDHIFSLSNFIGFEQMVDVIITYPRYCVPFELS